MYVSCTHLEKGSEVHYEQYRSLIWSKLESSSLKLMKNNVARYPYIPVTDFDHTSQNLIQTCEAKYVFNFFDVLSKVIHRKYHRRRKYGGSSPNSLRPKSYFGSIWELYVLDPKTNVFCRKKIQLHFPMNKGLTVPK